MKKVVVYVLLVFSIFLVSCSSEVAPEKQCSVDEDCVKSICCHADSAVNKEFGPDCAGMMCTADCVPGTLDCQQGEIKCLSGECSAVLKE